MTPYVLLLLVLGPLLVAARFTRQYSPVPASANYFATSRGRYGNEAPSWPSDPERDFRRWTYFDLVIIAVLITFSGMRSGVGTDYPMYQSLYLGLHSTEWGNQLAASPQEFGYTLLSLILRASSSSDHAIFWACAILTVVPGYVALKRVSRNPEVAILLYVLLSFYVISFNIVRQGVAVSLVLLAYTYLRSSLVAYWALIGAAMLFHTSAVIAGVLIWAVCRWRPSPKKLGVACGILSIVALSPVLSTVLPNLLASLNPRYEQYYVESTGSGIGTYLLALSRLAVAIYCFRRATGQDSINRVNLILIGIPFLVLGTQSVAIGRMEYYFGIFVVMELANVLAAPLVRSRERCLVVLTAAIYFVFFVNSFGDLVPYTIS